MHPAVGTSADARCGGRLNLCDRPQVLSSKVAEMTTDIAANRARQPLQGVGTTGNCARSQHRQGGIKVLEDAVPGDVLVAVPKDEVLVASSREELVLAVMEAMHDSNTASGSVQHPAWVHAVGRLSGRLAPRLLAGCCSGEVLDALSGEDYRQAKPEEAPNKPSDASILAVRLLLTIRVGIVRRHCSRTSSCRRGPGFAASLCCLTWRSE